MKSSPPSDPRLAGPRIKGLAFREFILWYEQTRGREAAMRAFHSLTPELRAHLNPSREAFGVLPASWYPVGVATSLLEAITHDVTPEERSAILRDGVLHTLSTAMNGVYRALFRLLMTPERHAQYAQKIWSSFYDSGMLEAMVVAPGRGEQRVRAWTGHHAILCEMSTTVLTYFHEAMGLKDVHTTRASCVAGGADACRFVITWRV